MRFANAINRLFVAAQTDQCVMVRTAFVYKRGSRYQGSADKNWTSVTSPFVRKRKHGENCVRPLHRLLSFDYRPSETGSSAKQ